MGLSCNFISYTKEGFTMRSISAVSLLHNVFPRPRIYEDLAFSKQIWDIYDDFGVSKSEEHLYWKQNEIKADGKVYISYFINDKNETLLFITSLERDIEEVDIKLDKTYSKIYDLLDNDEKTTVNGDIAKVPLQYANIKICKLV